MRAFALNMTSQQLVDGVFLDTPDDVEKRLGDGKTKLSYVAEGTYKVLEVSARAVVIQGGRLLERVTVDRVTPEPTPLNPPEEHLCAPTTKDLLKKMTTGWWIELSSNVRNATNPLKVLVQWFIDHAPTWKLRAIISEDLISRYFSSKQDPHSNEATTARA